MCGGKGLGLDDLAGRPPPLACSSWPQSSVPDTCHRLSMITASYLGTQSVCGRGEANDDCKPCHIAHRYSQSCVCVWVEGVCGWGRGLTNCVQLSGGSGNVTSKENGSAVHKLLEEQHQHLCACTCVCVCVVRDGLVIDTFTHSG